MDEVMDDAGLAISCKAVTSNSGTPTIQLIGELDLGSVGPIRAVFNDFVADGPARLVIDLSDLGFMDSTGLSLFLDMADRVPEVELRNPSAMVRRVIDLTGISSVFVITP